MFTRVMRSKDPSVIDAITERERRQVDGQAHAREWAKSKGGRGVLASMSHVAYRVAGVVADRAPSPGWRSVGRSAHGAHFAPPVGSLDAAEMMALAVDLPAVPGLPAIVSGVHRGETVMGVPEVFVRDGAAYSIVGFSPDSAQRGQAALAHGWEACAMREAFEARSRRRHPAGCGGAPALTSTGVRGARVVSQ